MVKISHITLKEKSIDFDEIQGIIESENGA